MDLCFETQPELTDGYEVPMLVDVSSIHVGNNAERLYIDGRDISLDPVILQNITDAVARINDENLPAKHFRDCVSFTMGVSGVWMPTHPPFDAAYMFEQVCRSDVGVGSDLLGPVSSGFPNDSRHLGFENEPYIYSHMAFGLQTSDGNLMMYKNGVHAEYLIQPVSAMLEYYEHEFVHPVERIGVTHRDDGELVRWERE